jgi:hypothetical protein
MSAWLSAQDGPLPTAEDAPKPSYTSGATPSGGQPSGCCTPAATSEAGAHFADAALSPPTEAGVRAPTDTGGTSSQVISRLRLQAMELRPSSLPHVRYNCQLCCVGFCSAA